MALHRELIAGYFGQLSTARRDRRPVVYTFVPGNLTELMLSFDVLPVHPEINAIQAALRKRSGGFILKAERAGFSGDVCADVKCDIGMLEQANGGPTGEKLPRPDLLLLSYTGSSTYLKWFELLRERYGCPVAMLHVPYQSRGELTPPMREYVTRQLREEIVPKLEAVSGRRYDEDRLRELLTRSAKAEDDLVWVIESAKRRPSPIDGFFGGVHYVGPLFGAFRGTSQAVQFYSSLRREVQARIDEGLGPITPEGPLSRERYRIVVEGVPDWTHLRELWKMFYDEGAVAVASTCTRVGGLYDQGFRHDPARPLESLAEYCIGCYTNLSLPARIDLLAGYMRDYEADGFVINSVRSSKSFSVGQPLILRELERRTGLPGAFIESDAVDPRYFSTANIRTRLDGYFEMIEQRRGRGASSGRGDAAGVSS